MQQDYKKSIKKTDFYRLWLPITILGATLVLISIFMLPHPYILTAILACYTGLSAWAFFYFFHSFYRLQERLLTQSREDQLTGLKNRRYLEERIIELLAKYHRDKEGFGIIFFDIINFKDYNDQYGHMTGDKILQSMANFLLKNTREQETLARYGGDEFVLLLPGSSQEEAHITAKRLRRELEAETFKIDNGNYTLKISGGVAVCPEDGTELYELLETADKYLKLAKSKSTQTYSSSEKNRQLADFYPPLMINEKNDYLEKTGKKNLQFYLLAKSGELEIIRQHIAADNVIRLWGESNTFEFYYLMEGEIIQRENERVLGPGSSITVQNLTDEVYFETKSDCTFLYITTIPAFEDHQKQIRELLSLSRRVEKRDQQTDKHCLRLQKLSRRTGEIMGMKEDQLFALDYASVLHDIGKAEIPTQILNKPGKLDEEEWNLIKKHPQIGYDLILNHLKRPFFNKVANIVYQHHERHDGNGYPQGLSGEEILPEARVLTIVDAYDAMTSNRPYRKALDRNIVLKEIEDKKGTQFDPGTVEAFYKAESQVYKELPKEKSNE